MAYLPIPQREEGGVDRTLVSDERAIQLLKAIYVVLKKIETHLSVASDTELKDEDV